MKAECRYDGTVGELRPDTWKTCDRTTLEGVLGRTGAEGLEADLYASGSVRFEYPGPGEYGLKGVVRASQAWMWCYQQDHVQRRDPTLPNTCESNEVHAQFTVDLKADLTVPKTPNLSGTYTEEVFQTADGSPETEYTFTVTNTGDEPVHGGVQARLNTVFTGQDEDLAFKTADPRCSLSSIPPAYENAVLTCDLGTVPGHGSVQVKARTTDEEPPNAHPRAGCHPWFTWGTTTIDDTGTHTSDTDGLTSCGYIERLTNADIETP
ncbi:hypothetical protein ACIA8O_24910 [Kitasatospora sp. NPDC051853]|uniref:hypothetical protein n=1 Tax=Kitasatospora sp. NPDC051853 TaxID=3364058 RepID=UPI0037BABC1B